MLISFSDAITEPYIYYVHMMSKTEWLHINWTATTVYFICTVHCIVWAYTYVHFNTALVYLML